MAKLYHPDTIEDNNYELQENFLLIAEAYDILGDVDLRKKYDEAY